VESINMTKQLVVHQRQQQQQGDTFLMNLLANVDVGLSLPLPLTDGTDTTTGATQQQQTTGAKRLVSSLYQWMADATFPP
jgi:hypothetical protein